MYLYLYEGENHRLKNALVEILKCVDVCGDVRYWCRQ